MNYIELGNVWILTQNNILLHTMYIMQQIHHTCTVCMSVNVFQQVLQSVKTDLVQNQRWLGLDGFVKAQSTTNMQQMLSVVQ